MSASPEPDPTVLTVEQRCASSTAEQPTKEEPASPVAQDSSMLDVVVPQLLQQGVPMLKVSAKKQKRYIFKLDPDQGQIVWESKKHRIIPIENIKELREGADARYYREQFQLSPSFEDRWLTIVYVLDGRYKTLHLIAGTRDVFQMWDITLRRLYAIRQKLMSGLGHADIRQAVWEKQFWRSAAGEVAEGADNKLDFEEVERMCRRLNISPSREDLMIRFKQADTHNRGYLDFSDFQRFVKALKARPEVDSLYWRLASDGGGAITFEAFERFMRTSQKFDQSEAELQRIFLRYASSSFTVGYSSAPSSPQQDILDLGVQSSSQTEINALSTTSPEADGYSPPSSIAPTYSTSSTSFLTVETAAMTLKGFTTFLLSTDNSAFVDQHGKIYHDMTRPLPEYYVSSSHNTYLVGHQLVGESTIEGYIRALLHSCRSVELDIYDGDVEPVIYHGRTLTTKVALRDTCAAINKYAFVSSPYPIVISAEIHCSLHQQDMIASIMRKEFGDALINAPIDGRPRVDVLPSPEDLKGRVLLKAKNLYVSESDALQEKEVVVDTESSSTDTSASDMDPGDELKQGRRTARENEADVIKDLKSEFRKARNVLGRVRSPRRELTRALSLSPQGDVLDMSMPRQPAQKVKMSFALVALLVYTVGVKCRGLNKKEIYAPEHMFSLSEKTANRMMRQGMMDLIKHNRTHLVRIYPKGTRIGSTNFEPHRYWSAGAQLVAINWQTFDLGYMINRAMFQRNGRAGYVLKPLALRNADKQLLSKRTNYSLEVTIISAQQLPRQKDSLGREIVDRSTLDPFVEVSVHVPDWTHAPYQSQGSAASRPQSPSRDVPSSASASTSQPAAISARTVTCRTGVIRNNGFNPVWEQHLSLPFDLVGDMRDLVFVRFAVMHDGALEDEPLAVYCASLGSLNMGYRHLPLHDAQLSQYLFSTLFVRLEIRDR
ncbi:1-phosphatidylinositol-4,5-bisphosphate phosphodiesterase 1 [Laetiporus sulphureus 93-53]|uniref:Phosphoinositide phospholipase C n=1 Tax=Laetiporus sulphureus 93-53 TaxID=1314785 RepID=A0A165F025_9APHY|nr:1-phosphatidylinositol-4,5-bisphosphate phosphodiesterase 1 [Laetiporus sulphureus 93-53]KZT08084.1 1-phosphatidylinositol-4,5-bisphosphate phosphodiesterase 1 [Laetiporus sulphureus 93-53]